MGERLERRPILPETFVEWFYRYFTLGQSIEEIARATNRRSGVVGRVLKDARWAAGHARPLPTLHRRDDIRYDPREVARRANLRFCIAMLQAIKNGHEQAPVGVYKAKPNAASIRMTVHPPSIGSMTSASGWIIHSEDGWGHVR